MIEGALKNLGPFSYQVALLGKMIGRDIDIWRHVLANTVSLLTGLTSGKQR